MKKNEIDEIKKIRQKERKFPFHNIILIAGVALLTYLFIFVKIHILFFKLIEGIIAATIIHNFGYVSLFTIVLILTILIPYSIAKWMIYEIIMPTIIIVDEKNNKMRFKRRILTIKKNGEIKGWYIKFRLFPIFEFDKFILNGTKWERKIKSIYVYANNIKWNEKEKAFMPFESYTPAYFESIKAYRFFIQELNELIGTEVGKAVAGDPNIRKDKFEEGLPNPKEEKWKEEEI